jgi:hypothetical protein
MIQATMIGKNYTSRTTGATYVWEEDVIIFASRGHKIPAKSVAEDEHMTAFHCAIWCVWLRHLLTEMHYGILVAEPAVMARDAAARPSDPS